MKIIDYKVTQNGTSKDIMYIKVREGSVVKTIWERISPSTVLLTNAQIHEIRKRVGIVVGGVQKYKSTGDVSPNSHGNWDRIVSQKNAYLTDRLSSNNVTAERWNGVHHSYEVRDAGNNESNRAAHGRTMNHRSAVRFPFYHTPAGWKLPTSLELQHMPPNILSTLTQSGTYTMGATSYAFEGFGTSGALIGESANDNECHALVYTSSSESVGLRSKKTFGASVRYVKDNDGTGGQNTTIWGETYTTALGTGTQTIWMTQNLKLGNMNEQFRPQFFNNNWWEKMLCAAYFNLIAEYGNKTPIVDALKEDVLWTVANADISDEYAIVNAEREQDFIWAANFARLPIVYDMIKHHLTLYERNTVKEYLDKQADYYLIMMNEALNRQWGNRMLGDGTNTQLYESNLGVPTSTCEAQGKYTHINPDNSLGNLIPLSAYYFNNRKSDMFHTAFICGLVTGYEKPITDAKRYFREMLMFSTFPNGTMGEYERNYAIVPQQGLIYSAMNISCMTIWAYALALKGDYDLFNFQTSYGRCGTQGGNKSLFLLIDNYCKQITRQTLRYAVQVSSGYEIDEEVNVGTQQNIYSSVHFTSMANIYYKYNLFKSVYMRTDPHWGGAYFINYNHHPGHWSHLYKSLIPGALLTYGQMEDVVNLASTPIVRSYYFDNSFEKHFE
jgi:hypothetical protein